MQLDSYSKATAGIADFPLYYLKSISENSVNIDVWMFWWVEFSSAITELTHLCRKRKYSRITWSERLWAGGRWGTLEFLPKWNYFMLSNPNESIYIPCSSLLKWEVDSSLHRELGIVSELNIDALSKIEVYFFHLSQTCCESVELTLLGYLQYYTDIIYHLGTLCRALPSSQRRIYS